MGHEVNKASQGQQWQGSAHGSHDDMARAEAFKRGLHQTIQERGLMYFYPPGSPAIDEIAHRATERVSQLCSRWRLPWEVGCDLAKLGLYDVVLYIGQYINAATNSRRLTDMIKTIRDLCVSKKMVSVSRT